MRGVQRDVLERLLEVQARAQHSLPARARLEQPRERLGLSVGRCEHVRRPAIRVHVVRVHRTHERRERIALWSRQHSTCMR